MHVAGQFKILQNKFETDAFDNYPQWIVRHKTLYDFMEKLEHLFSLAVLSQLLMSSLLLCVAGFQGFFVSDHRF